MPRNITVHAAGIVVTDKPVAKYVPLAVSNSAIVTQFDMDTIAKLGLLKFDFLALRYLTIINDACSYIKEKESDFDIGKVPFDDKATYELISSGATLGIFQLESSGMRQMLTELRPDSLDDIIAAIALYRPGPMDSIPQYIQARHNPQKITYAHPILEPILRSTYGCIVYQEQVMSIFRQMAGYTYGHADVVRRAMSKKKADVLNAERESFLEGTAKNGISNEIAGKLFDDISSFANYAFNKSHAAAYAVISYRTAYLKAHYPCEYMAALMTSVLGNLTKLAEYIGECSSLGIKVLPPDINESRTHFHPEKDSIVFGLLALKNIGKQFAQNIQRERKDGKFSDFEDFVQRMSEYDINKRMVEGLIKAGAFDKLGTYRSRLLASYERLIDIRTAQNKSNVSGQLDMFSSVFGADNSSQSLKFDYPPLPEFSLREKLMLEKESSGMYFSGHIIDSYSDNIGDISPSSITELLDGETVKEKQTVRICGIVSSVTVKMTRKNEKMAFITVEDRYGEIECLVFPKIYSQNYYLMRTDAPLYIEGTITVREDEAPKILVNVVDELTDNAVYAKIKERKVAVPSASVPTDMKKSAASKIYLRVDDIGCKEYLKAKNIVDIFEGTTKVIFYSLKDRQYVGHEKGIDATAYTIRELSAILGKENVVVK